MNTLYINYTKTGNPISDHQVESNILAQASLCKNGQDKQWNVSTENVVDCARMMKLTGKITCNLEIMFEGNLLEMNRYCVIVNGYPLGFCDYSYTWTAELMSAQMSLRKSDCKYINKETNDEKNNV
jgi:hypothetical protein